MFHGGLPITASKPPLASRAPASSKNTSGHSSSQWKNPCSREASAAASRYASTARDGSALEPWSSRSAFAVSAAAGTLDENQAAHHESAICRHRHIAEARPLAAECAL